MSSRLTLALSLLALMPGCPGTTATDAGMDAPRAADVPVRFDLPPAPDVGADVRADVPSATDTPTATDTPSTPDTGGTDAGMCIDLPPTPDRPASTTCSPCRPPGISGPGPGGGGGGCTSDADCTAGMNGRCSFGMIGSFCSYDECFTDGDCAKNEVCSCDGEYGSGANRCVPSECMVNADCTSGRCSPSYGCLLDGPPEGWYCRTSSDLCATNADCSGLGARCAYNSTAMRWECETGICVP